MDPTTVEDRFAALESNLRTVTDQIGGIMDRVLKKGFVPAFRCGHSGLLLPADYIKDWGRKYGIGLGPSPVSEVLNSDYDMRPAVPEGNALRRIDQIMHPVGPCMSQVDFDLFEPEEAQAGWAVLDMDDPGMFERSKIVRSRQLVNPRGRIQLFTAKAERA